MRDPKASLTRAEIRRVFSKHFGASADLAKSLGISKTSVSLWLRGKSTSQPIADAALVRAQELLRQAERQEDAA